MRARKSKIRIDKAHYERLKSRAEAVGYCSVDELIQHVLEREAGRFHGGAAPNDAGLARRRLRGLGYIS
jgi:hypothetical protein